MNLRAYRKDIKEKLSPITMNDMWDVVINKHISEIISDCDENSINCNTCDLYTGNELCLFKQDPEDFDGDERPAMYDLFRNFLISAGVYES